jgi:pyruvate dehydrogenase E1 component alpha subunit
MYRPNGVSESLFPEPPTRTTATRGDLLDMFRMMALIRRVEIVSDQQYKARMIRGFCHLYSGQEAVCTGMEAALDKNVDCMITAYRDHGNQLVRGDTAEAVFAELFGRATGCSKGKGGSMHFYKRDANFFGGNGIVGAQCPVGTGLAFAQKRLGTKGISVACFGDGAANQGQIYEAMNMASLWKLPMVYLCENNMYGMGTSTKRAAANDEYFTRGQWMPGIKVDGMHVLAVREAMRMVKGYALENGPVMVEMFTYRYAGHSMSDPGVSYRSRDEVAAVRAQRDPIEKLRDIMVRNKVVSEEELVAVEKEVRAEVEAALQKALAAPEPAPEQLRADIYMGEYSGNLRGCNVE